MTEESMFVCSKCQGHLSFHGEKTKTQKKQLQSLVSEPYLFFILFYFFWRLRCHLLSKKKKKKGTVSWCHVWKGLLMLFFLFSVDNKFKTEFVLTFLIFCSRQFQKQSKSHFNQSNKYKQKEKKVVLHSCQIAIVPQRLVISCVWKNGKKKASEKQQTELCECLIL